MSIQLLNRVRSKHLCGSLATALIMVGCAGAEHFKREFKEAQREREVLRDAYESQQVRLRELESRLLQLEDEGLPSKRSSKVHAVPTRMSAQERESPTRQRSRDRLRALPVVMVKRDPPPSSSGIDFDPKRRAKRSTKERSRPSSRRRPRETVQRRRLSENIVRETPSLNSANIGRYQSQDEREDSKVTQTNVSRPLSENTVARSLEKTSQVSPRSSSRTAMIPAPPTPLKDETLLEQEHSSQITQGASSSSRISSSLKTNSSQRSKADDLLTQAQSARSSGKREEASRLLRRMISDHPTHPLIPDALYLMGLLQIEQGKKTLGRSTLLRLSRLYPTARAAEAAKRYLEIGGS